jgi:hypothetical protein
MSDTLDVDLQDDEQSDEIQLLAELMVLASECSGTLDERTIDETLGLTETEKPLPFQRRRNA